MRLPNGWAEAKLADVAERIDYGFTASATVDPIGPKMLRITDLTPDGVEWSKVPHCDCKLLDRFGLRSRDIVVARTGATTGKSFLLTEVPEPSVFASYLIRLTMHPELADFPNYLAKYMQSSAYWRQIQASSKGTAQGGVNATVLSQLTVPVPPLEEQRRIVRRIEELTARAQGAKTELALVPPLVERLRAAVLAAAFSGRLTERWRVANSRSISCGVNSTGPYALPPTWEWRSLGSLGEIKGGLQKQPFRTPVSNHYPYLRVANVLWGRLDLSELKRMELLPGELEKLALRSGDLLIVEGNGSASEIGRMAVWDGSVPDCVHQNHIIRVRLKSYVLPGIVSAYWSSPVGRLAVLRQAKTTTGLHTLSKAKLASLLVPVPPMDEQLEVERVTTRLFEQISSIYSVVEEQLQRGAKIESAILSKAFRGELVPQDPNDEPASVLLERLRAQKAEQPARTRKKRA